MRDVSFRELSEAHPEDAGDDLQLHQLKSRPVGLGEGLRFVGVDVRFNQRVKVGRRIGPSVAAISRPEIGGNRLGWRGEQFALGVHIEAGGGGEAFLLRQVGASVRDA